MPADRSLLRGWAALTALVAAASLLLQYLLLVTGPGGSAGIAAATLRFFGYFTILSNLAVCVGCLWLASGRALRATPAAVLALCIGAGKARNPAAAMALQRLSDGASDPAPTAGSSPARTRRPPAAR